MKFYFKVYRTEKEVLIAICDYDILGKKYRFKDVVFEVKKEFYGGEVAGEKEIVEILKTATIINAVGVKIVDLLIKEGYVDKENVLKIGDTVHAQVAFL